MTGKTVFVIGAGASTEANLPTSEKLKGIIARLLYVRESYPYPSRLDDNLTYDALRFYAKEEINSYLEAAKHINEVLPSLGESIDRFIDSHPENSKIAICGKLAIVRSIISAEKDSKLYIDNSNIYNKLNFNKLISSWYPSFFQILTGGRPKSELPQRLKSVSLVIFNYDRCVEHYLFNALKDYYRIQNEEAIKLLKQISIFHPYGVIGNLPWQSSGNMCLEFGEESLRPEQLFELSKNIRTFTEGADPKSSEIWDIKTCMTMADKLIFLGFAFDELNLELISPRDIKAEKANNLKCFASTYGISDSDKGIIHNHLTDMFKSEIDIKMLDKTCHEFFDEFKRSLAF